MTRDHLRQEEPRYRFSGVQAAAAVGPPGPHAGEGLIVSVQFQEGVRLQPENILEYLRKKIGEKAAIPKETILLDEMPLTAERNPGKDERNIGFTVRCQLEFL